MSDRNRWQQTAARKSLYANSPQYGRTSTQSGYGVQTGGRSSLTPGRASNQSQLSPVREGSSLAQRTSNMAVINPPAINSNNRRRYFLSRFYRTLWFLKNLKS